VVAGRRASNHSTATQRGDHSLQSRNTLKLLNFHEVTVNHIPRIMIEQNHRTDNIQRVAKTGHLRKEKAERHQSASVTSAFDVASFS